MDFAQARMYSNKLGRFNSADAPFMDQSENEPQSWSLYAYARNNPLNLVDQFGMAAECPRGWEGCVEKDGKYYWDFGGETGLVEISQDMIQVDSQESNVKGMVCGQNGCEIKNLTVGQAIQLQQENKRNAVIDNILFGIGEGLAGAFGKIGRFFSRTTRAETAVVTQTLTTEASDVNQYQALKRLLRSQMGKPTVVDPELQKLMNDLYRANAKVGSGSTAAAVREEIATGQGVGGVFHKQKAQDYLKGLERWLKNNPLATAGDKHAAEQVILDLKDALGQ